MQIKKFNNLWLIGIILFSVILFGLYALKFIYPNSIIQIAEVSTIVTFGEYVDSHLWAYYLFNGLISFVVGCVYCCACCRKKYLSRLEHLIVLIEVILLFIIEYFLPEYYLSLNLICMIILPTIINAINKYKDIKYLYSTVITFAFHSIAQLLTLSIRGMSMLITYPNSATFTILIIDVFIWVVLLYNYFNYKENKNGKT